MVKRTKLVPILLLTVLLGCAVRKAPQLSAETQWRLNTAAQLSQANKDYTQFFTDVGNAQRSGFLSADQVSQLNLIGHNLKTSLEIANQEWSAYISGTGTKAAVINAILKAEEIFLQLTSQRAKMGVK
jgi:hypothetical protein